MCQCPERGDLHFHAWFLASFETVDCVNALKGATFISTKKTGRSLPAMTSCVNALKGATFISTMYTHKYYKLVTGCVNALKGATFISTLASGNPHE